MLKKKLRWEAKTSCRGKFSLLLILLFWTWFSVGRSQAKRSTMAWTSSSYFWHCPQVMVNTTTKFWVTHKQYQNSTMVNHSSFNSFYQSLCTLDSLLAVHMHHVFNLYIAILWQWNSIFSHQKWVKHWLIFILKTLKTYPPSSPAKKSKLCQEQMKSD